MLEKSGRRCSGISLMGVWVERKQFGLLLLIVVVGLFFMYQGSRVMVDEYFCLPANKEDLEFATGILVDIKKSRKFGDSIQVDLNGSVHEFGLHKPDDLYGLLNTRITVGFAGGFFCRAHLMHIESEGGVIRDFDRILSNYKNGRWFLVLMSFIYFLLSVFVFVNGFFKLKSLSPKRIRKTN